MRKQINGIWMSVSEAGQGDPIVFLHGFPFTSACWSAQIRDLSIDHRVIVPDQRGFGQTETTGGTVTMEQFAHDLKVLLTDLQSGPVTLVGHSMGGYIAMAFAKVYPEMLARLVLVATRATADSSDARDRRHKLVERVSVRGPEAAVEAMLPTMLADGTTDTDKIAGARALMAPLNPTGLNGALLGMAKRHDSIAFLPQIKIPTLVIAGERDMVIPVEEMSAMAAAIAKSRIKVIPGAGHLVFWEKPLEFNNALREWLSDAASSRFEDIQLSSSESRV